MRKVNRCISEMKNMSKNRVRESEGVSGFVINDI